MRHRQNASKKKREKEWLKKPCILKIKNFIIMSRKTCGEEKKTLLGGDRRHRDEITLGTDCESIH
jgi:hypothetical protein